MHSRKGLLKEEKKALYYLYLQQEVYNQFKEMKDLQDKVWYACYDSNLLKENFLCYIMSGQPAGAKTVYGGCLDKTIPSESDDMYINSKLYFARASKNWNNGGVAFIRTTFSPTVSTMGRSI